MRDRAHGQRALAKGANHLLAPGLDPFRNCDLAFARQQLHTAHFPQIHADWIVRAADIVIIQVTSRPGVGCDGTFLCLARFLRLFILNDVDAHFREKRHHVLDLLGRGVVRRHHRVQLINRDIATLFSLRDQLFDRGRHAVHQRAVGGCIGLIVGYAFACCCLRCHS